jgi:CBS domain-containing protein
VARRGYHVSREYSVDPLELTSIGDVMTRDVVSVPASMPVSELLLQYYRSTTLRKHQAYPVVDRHGSLLGVITRTNLLEDWVSAELGEEGSPPRHLIIAYDLIHREPIVAFPWESCRTAAERMAQHGVGRLPVVAQDDPRKMLGIVTRSDLLKPRARTVEEEERRERFLGTGRPGEGAS